MNRGEGRALALLADTGRDGTTDAILAAREATASMVTKSDTRPAGVATTDQVRADTRMTEIVRVRVTMAGQRAIEGQARE
jgi:hypothetical protein